MADEVSLKAGSRKSMLALIQTNLVIEKLKELDPKCSVQVVSMATLGDNVLDKPLPKVGKNVFTKELEDPLIDGKLDFVVHSLKDVSTSMPEGLTIGAVLKREDPADVLLTPEYHGVSDLNDLKHGAVVGTSSLRRQAQLRAKYPHLSIRDIRGNLNTRIRKLDDLSNYAGIIVALAGIKRLEFEDRICGVLNPPDWFYAVGQGALAVECRSNDEKILNMLAPLNDTDTVLRVVAERSFMKDLGGGCTAPLGVSTSLNLPLNELSLTGCVWSLCGKTKLEHTLAVSLSSESYEPPKKQAHLQRQEYTGITAKNVDSVLLEKAYQLGIDVAAILKTQGAVEVIEKAKVATEYVISAKD